MLLNSFSETLTSFLSSWYKKKSPFFSTVAKNCWLLLLLRSAMKFFGKWIISSKSIFVAKLTILKKDKVSLIANNEGDSVCEFNWNTNSFLSIVIFSFFK